MLGVLQIPASTAFVLDGILMGASDFRFLQWTTVAALVVFAPLAAVVVAADLSLTALWMGMVAWMSARAAVSYARYRRGRWIPFPGCCAARRG